MDSEQANVTAIDGRIDERISNVYKMTRNVRTEDFATILGERFDSD